MSVLAYFLGLLAGSLKCTLTGVISACSISLWTAYIWGKPTARSSWEVAKVEWEARAMRKYDEEQEALARTQGQQTRARIQDEAGHGRKRRNAEIRQVERGRQWDRQREEIHPAEVLERLARIEEKKPAQTKLPPAVRDTDPDRPVRTLRIRRLREEP